MSQPVDQLRKTLKQHGYSLTAARQAVFECLLDSEPRTVHDVIEACTGVADRASVYRTVSLFEELGIVHRLQLGWKYKLELSDDFSHHHHHLTCTACGNVIPLPEDIMLEAHLRRVAQQRGFDPLSHQLEIRGTCADCQTPQK
jgi:Fur family ferric uptake transcriptional regulator